MANVMVVKPGVNTWMESGACRGLNAEGLFFPIEGIPFSPDRAKLICNGSPRAGKSPCPVRDTCLNRALEKRDVGVVRGGMDDDERRAELRRRQRIANHARNTAGAVNEQATSETEPTPAELLAGASPTPTSAPQILAVTTTTIVGTKPRLQELLDHLLEQLGQNTGTITLEGDHALEQLAKAMRYPNWAAARSFIQGLSDGGLVVYLPFSRRLTVYCDLAKSRLDKEERELRMPNYLWRAAARETNVPAEVPPDYQHLVHETTPYVRTQPFKDGMVPQRHMADILGRIVEAGGELRDVSTPQLADDLGESVSAASRMLQNLDAGGYIQRDKDRSNRVRNGSPLRITGHGVAWMLSQQRDIMLRYARKSA